MSKAYEMIAESLNEIISDLEETGGENLKREKMELKAEEKIPDKKFQREVKFYKIRKGVAKWNMS